MKRTIAGIRAAAALAAVALGVSACSVDSQQAPSYIGPSGFGLSVTMTAAPDRLPRDGQSQSVVTLTLRNDSSQPVSGQLVTLGVSAGSLSQAEVVTGSDGRATFVVTAPAAETPVNGIDVFASPGGANFDNARFHSVSIALTGLSNTAAPTPSFAVTPEAPEVGQSASFDASATVDDGAACGTACTYTWNFGDGTTDTGRLVAHAFSAPGTYAVVLTVRDAAGTTSTTQRVVTVSPVAPPTVSLTVAPAAPIAGQVATFTANAAVASGHRITQYVWNFGDGTGSQTTASGTIAHVFESAGSRVVSVTVTDDRGQTAGASTAVSVTTGITVLFRPSPVNPAVGQTVQFDPMETVVPAGIVIREYRWSFGNGDSMTTTPDSPIASTTYGSANTFTVRLSVVDTQGRITNGFATIVVGAEDEE